MGPLAAHHPVMASGNYNAEENLQTAKNDKLKKQRNVNKRPKVKQQDR